MGRKNPWYHPNCAASSASLLPVTRETPHLFEAGLGAGSGTASVGTSHRRFPLFDGLARFLALRRLFPDSKYQLSINRRSGNVNLFTCFQFP